MTQERNTDVFSLVSDDEWSLDSASLPESGAFLPLSRADGMVSDTRPARAMTTREIAVVPPARAPQISADMLERDAKLALRRGDTRLAMKLLDRVRQMR